MKITRIETIHVAEFANILWVLVHTDAGPVTFFASATNSPLRVPIVSITRSAMFSLLRPRGEL